MNKKPTLSFKVVDGLLIALAILPILALIVLKILFTPASQGIEISGALIYFTIPMPLQDMPITESQVNSLAVIITVTSLCLYITHGIRAKVETKRQILAEWIVEKVEGMVRGNMGEFFKGFGPFIASILAISAFSSLLTLFGLYAPTSDINIVAGWAILVFALITYYKAICGPVQYVKSFGDPVPLLAPLNIISEIATPVSMAFRHYGNVLSGSVISVLVVTALQGLSNMLFGWLPGFLGDISFLGIGIPAVLSIYFDVFSGCLQAYIFAMLTMLYVAGAFPEEKYALKKQLRAEKKLQTKNN
ncbi:MAG: F0F1 ATP synthase subunit A [Clostridia bacterium]|nr:F0F1 ATP synthase subunit A [Clostridia bacterium]